jgi:hypothetical protein
LHAKIQEESEDHACAANIMATGASENLYSIVLIHTDISRDCTQHRNLYSGTNFDESARLDMQSCQTKSIMLLYSMFVVADAYQVRTMT